MTRCLNASGLGKKLEESEVCVQLQGYDLIRIKEMWWDSSHYWMQWMKWINGGSLERWTHPLCERAAGMHGALPWNGW